MHCHGRLKMDEEQNGCFAERRSKIVKMGINIWLDCYIIMKLLSKKAYFIHFNRILVVYMLFSSLQF